VIPAGFLQDLLSRVDIVDVVGRHVELKRGGANFMGLCPFHGEKSPSFSVSPVKQFYYCFGCGASGDAIRFLTEQSGLSFVEAVRELAQGVGMVVPEEQVSAEERQRRDTLRQRRVSLTEVLTRASDFYRDQLRQHPRAIGYLKGRGLTGASAARFGLGFAPPGWRNLASVFPSYDDPLLEEGGLVRQKEAEPGAPGETQDRGRYDWFRDRIMFPIRSVDGQVIGFGGRVMDDSKPKYINSPETPLFSKGRELYGLFEARQALRDKGYVLVVEGYMDVVALAQSGFANAVATLGTACTADHVQKLFRFTDSVVFSFDGDAAGRRAASRALEAALPHATDLRSVRFLFLPPEHDPDSYVREQGSAAFEAQVAQALPLSRQLIAMASEGADLGTPEGRTRLLAQARPWWLALPDAEFKRQILAELAKLAQRETSALAADWGAGVVAPSKGGPAGPRGALAAPAKSWTPGHRGRRAPAAPADLALRLLLRHADWWDRLDADDREMLHSLEGPHGEALGWLERQLTEHGPQPWSALSEALAQSAWAEAARGWIDSAAPDEAQQFDDLQTVVYRLWVDRLGRQAQAMASADPIDLEALRTLHAQIGRYKALLAGRSD
jgi:DNA primase